jgi:hypothetical protein
MLALRVKRFYHTNTPTAHTFERRGEVVKTLAHATRSRPDLHTYGSTAACLHTPLFTRCQHTAAALLRYHHSTVSVSISATQRCSENTLIVLLTSINVRRRVVTQLTFADSRFSPMPNSALHIWVTGVVHNPATC